MPRPVRLPLNALPAFRATVEPTLAYYLVYPPNLCEWPPLTLLREWLHDELELSRRTLQSPAKRSRGKPRSR